MGDKRSVDFSASMQYRQDQRHQALLTVRWPGPPTLTSTHSYIEDTDPRIFKKPYLPKLDHFLMPDSGCGRTACTCACF